MKIKYWFDFLILIVFSSILFINTSCDKSEELSLENGFIENFDGNSINDSIWHVATWTEHGGKTGTERCYASDGYLNMVFINDPNNGYLSSAIQTRKEFSYGRWEARLKPPKEAGVCASFYTIDWDDITTPASSSDGTKEEIDIEFLTFAFGANTGKVHFAVHKSGSTSFDTNPDVDLNFNPSDDFHIWGFEITPNHIEWFVDNQVLLTYHYTESNINISSNYQLKLNLWSATNWVNGPPTANVECLYQIDWIKFTPLN